MIKKYIAFIVRDDDQWIGKIDELGVRSQGKTLVELVTNLKDGVELSLRGEKPLSNN